MSALGYRLAPPSWAAGVGSAFALHKSMMTILLVVLVLMALGAIPAWPHSRSWGYAPTSTLTIVLVVLLILVLTGRV